MLLIQYGLIFLLCSSTFNGNQCIYYFNSLNSIISESSQFDIWLYGLWIRKKIYNPHQWRALQKHRFQGLQYMLENTLGKMWKIKEEHIYCCWSSFFLMRIIYTFLNVCPFNYTAFAVSGKVGTPLTGLSTSVRWLLLLKLTVLHRSAIVVLSKFWVAFLHSHFAIWNFLLV